MFRYTVTAALPYANGPVHIGHLAGCYIPADIYVRYLRMKGHDVLFVCGSDEHGIPITIKAKNEGKTPQEVVDYYHGLMKDAFSSFGIDFDVYSRTSSTTHKETASEFFLHLLNKGELLVKQTDEFFDAEAGEFLADRYITGTCPSCGNPDAYGDQCEKCGKSLSPDELINPVSKLSGSAPVKKPTKHWYIDLGKHQDAWLKDWILSKNDWKSNVRGQCLSWLGDGENKLKPRAITRDLKWGVPVPSQVEGHEGKMLYVWFDAPIGYISATKEFFQRSVDRPWVKGHSWEDYWADGKTNLVHFIGKDNIVFHCIIFPSMLKAHGGLALPVQVPANEFLNLEGKKISTSRNWAVWLHEYLKEMPGREDELRYVLTANMPETKDNDFIWKYDGTDNTTDSFQARVNNELVNNLGNFVNRVSVLIQKFYHGELPLKSDLFGDAERELHLLVQQTVQQVSAKLEAFEYRAALSEIMKLSSAGNKYLQVSEPWKTIKVNPESAAVSLYCSATLCGVLAGLLSPFLPVTSRKIADAFGWGEEVQNWSFLTNKGFLRVSQSVSPIDLLFRKVEDAEMDIQLEKLRASSSASESADSAPSITSYSPLKAEISFDDFSKMDIRVGRVLEAQKVPKADKLLQLTVDLGSENRTILSGIAEYFSPEEVKDRLVCVLANLAPRKMRGIESQGMILMTEDASGKLTFVSPEPGSMPGAEVR